MDGLSAFCMIPVVVGGDIVADEDFIFFDIFIFAVSVESFED